MTAGPQVNAVQNVALSAQTASFTLNGGTVATITATINWGDGTTTDSGQIVVAGTGFQVVGSHTYGSSGNFSIVTTITDTAATSNQTQMVTTAASVAPPPPPALVPPTGALAPGISSTNVNGTPLTNNTTPTFTGTAPAGNVVMLLAVADGTSSPTQVGMTTVPSNSTSWSIQSNSLTSGGYTFYVSVFDPNARATTTQTVQAGRLVIDAQGPQIAGITFDTKHGVFDVTYRDNVGLNAGSLLNLADYTISQGTKPLHPSSATIVPAGGNGSNLIEVAVAFNKNKKVKPAKYTLKVDSGHVQDSAGNNLDGEFNGNFPTGNGAPGGSFEGVYTVKTNLKVKSVTPARGDPSVAGGPEERVGPQAQHPRHPSEECPDGRPLDRPRRLPPRQGAPASPLRSNGNCDVGMN